MTTHAAEWWTLGGRGGRAPVPRATPAQRNLVLSNFCNINDSAGALIYTPLMCSKPKAQRQEWYGRQAEEGSTHIILMPDDPSYAQVQGRSWLEDPAGFVEFVAEALDTPSASGAGFVPQIFMDRGDVTSQSRIDKYWKPLLRELEPFAEDVDTIAAWEPVKGDWTSKQLDDRQWILIDNGVKSLWAHYSPDRWAGSSNPIEIDDPYQGAESGYYKMHSGAHLKGVLYQAPPGRNGDTFMCDPVQDACWLNRLDDGLQRIGTGFHEWRVMPICFFEGPAYWAFRGECSPATARDMATAAQSRAKHWGIEIGYGNGQPW